MLSYVPFHSNLTTWLFQGTNEHGRKVEREVSELSEVREEILEDNLCWSIFMGEFEVHILFMSPHGIAKDQLERKLGHEQINCYTISV